MKISKCVLALILSVVVNVIASKPAFAVSSSGNNIVLTENSPTDLSLVYTGALFTSSSFTVMKTAPDMWTITLPSSDFFAFSNGWIEPENSLAVNEVTHSTTVSPNQFFVHSDLSILQNTTSSPDNTAILVGANTFGAFFLTFHDVAMSAEASQGVPDGGSTITLLSLAAIGLLTFKRPRWIQLG